MIDNTERGVFYIFRQDNLTAYTLNHKLYKQTKNSDNCLLNLLNPLLHIKLTIQVVNLPRKDMTVSGSNASGVGKPAHRLSTHHTSHGAIKRLSYVLV